VNSFWTVDVPEIRVRVSTTGAAVGAVPFAEMTHRDSENGPSSPSTSLGGRLVGLLMTVLACVGGGCASTGPDRLEIRGDQYDTAYDAALEATREVGMPAIVSDRAGGAIEGRPRLAGSIIEPWRLDNSSADQWAASTLHKQRRRVRFEFLPLDFTTSEPTGEGDLLGSPLPGSGADLDRTVQLAGFTGPIEVRAWVWIEREQRPETRGSTWTRRGRTYTTNPLETVEPDDGTTRSSGIWTPVGRDVSMERRLLAEVEAAIAAGT
jgi:hypothetical protein